MHFRNNTMVALALIILVSSVQAAGASEKEPARDMQNVPTKPSSKSMGGLEAAFREVESKGIPLHHDRLPRTTDKELLTYLNEAYASRSMDEELGRVYLCLQLMRARPSERFTASLKELVEDENLPIPIKTGAISALVRIPQTKTYLISRGKGNRATVATSAIRVLASEHREGDDRTFYNELLGLLPIQEGDDGGMWLAIRDFHFNIQILDALRKMRSPDDQIRYLSRITFLYPEALWAVDPARLPIPAFILNALQHRHLKAPDRVEAVLHSLFQSTPERWQPHVVSILSHLRIKPNETEAKFNNRLPWSYLIEFKSNRCPSSTKRTSPDSQNDSSVSLDKFLGEFSEAQRLLPELAFSARHLASKEVTHRLGKFLSLPPGKRDTLSWKETEILLRMMQGFPRPEYAPVIERVVTSAGIPESITVRAIHALGAVDSSSLPLLQFLESGNDKLRAEAIRAIPQTMSKDEVFQFVRRLRAKEIDGKRDSDFERSAQAVDEIEVDLLSQWELADAQPSCAARVAFLMEFGFYRFKGYRDISEGPFAQYALRELKKTYQRDPEFFEDVAKLLFSLEPWCPPYGLPLSDVALIYLDFGYELTDAEKALLPGTWLGVAGD